MNRRDDDRGAPVLHRYQVEARFGRQSYGRLHAEAATPREAAAQITLDAKWWFGDRLRAGSNVVLLVSPTGEPENVVGFYRRFK